MDACETWGLSVVGRGGIVSWMKGGSAWRVGKGVEDREGSKRHRARGQTLHGMWDAGATWRRPARGHLSPSLERCEAIRCESINQGIKKVGTGINKRRVVDRRSCARGSQTIHRLSDATEMR